ncbi:hypothetical protein ACPA9J_08825 [Pseudomonas aeruginosa]
MAGHQHSFCRHSEWTSSYTQGVEEHLVDDGHDNKLSIARPDDDEPRPRLRHPRRQSAYSSEKDGFDVIVDGTTFSNPFYTDCEACSSSFPGFWAAPQGPHPAAQRRWPGR